MYKYFVFSFLSRLPIGIRLIIIAFLFQHIFFIDNSMYCTVVMWQAVVRSWLQMASLWCGKIYGKIYQWTHPDKTRFETTNCFHQMVWDIVRYDQLLKSCILCAQNFSRPSYFYGLTWFLRAVPPFLLVSSRWMCELVPQTEAGVSRIKHNWTAEVSSLVAHK